MKYNNNLRNKIWKSLIIFSIIILCFLWFFQVLFLNSYYEWVKTKDMSKIVNKLKNNYQEEGFLDLLDDITFDKGVCIEIVDGNKNTYSSTSYSRGCINKNNFQIDDIKNDFINSNSEHKNYRIRNIKFKNKTLLSAIKLDDNLYAFVNVSLQPLDSTINILSSQLMYVTFIVLVLSFFISYFISKKISNPISKITSQAKEMSKGNYNVVFDTNNDIEEINELGKTLNSACDTLSHTDELRRELMANVSHDLKTPLTMIKAYAEMVRDVTYNNEEKRTNNLNTIIDETDRLTILVNDILELSKIQSDVEQLNIEEFDLNVMIKDIINRFNYLTEKNECIFEYKEKENLIVKADKKKIEQVIYNLISNAINYVGKDKKVIIKITEEENVKVEIIDHGKGIDQKELNLIWDKYYKIDKNYKRNYIGTGLGLSIVKNILEKHGFDYGVKSTKDKGTTVYFKIKK